jgi:hypothetical protein
MKFKCSANYIAVVGALLFALPAAAQEFSAQGISHDSAGNTTTSKVYASGGKVRIESQGGAPNNGPPDARGSYSILDLAQQTSFVIDPARKVVLQQPPVRARTSLAEFTAGADPCARFRNPRTSGTGTCAKIGVEMLNGRTADRYEVKESLGGQPYNMNLWIDSRLHIVLKMEMPRGMLYELRDLREGPQPASLFELPADYQKLIMPGR